jgi:THO complex subunit 2
LWSFEVVVKCIAIAIAIAFYIICYSLYFFMTMTLPSSQELQDAAKNGDTGKCQELVLLAINYGTTPPHESLKERTQEACTVLADAWEDCLCLEGPLVDALWLSGSMITSLSATAGAADKSESSHKTSVDALVEIVKTLVQIPDRHSFWMHLQANLMPSLIDAAGLASSQEFLKKLKIHNTQVHYKQQKYNLLQEESEGYAKILHYFSSGDNGEVSNLRKLLGTFELDPNRVLDLAMDFLEATLYPKGCDSNDNDNTDDDRSKPQLTEHCQWLLGIMKELCLEKLPALIGFHMNAATYAPSFMRTVALLASQGMLDLTTLRNDHFGLVQDEIGQAHKVMWMKEKKRILAMSRISLSGATKVDPKQAELEQQFQSQVKPLKTNLFLEVLLLLIHWGEWGRIKTLFHFEIWSQLCSILPEEFGFALCDVAQERIQGWLRTAIPTPILPRETRLVSPSPTEGDEMEGVETQVSIDDAVNALSDSLLCVVHSTCIGYRPILFCQICRLFRALLSKTTTDAEHPVSDETYSFFKTFLVPSMSLFPSNPAISTELWTVLKRLPYATRYRLYEDWRGAGLERAGLSSSPHNGKALQNVLSEMEAGKAARYALKRLSKDNIRDMSRQLAKVTHSNPLVVYATILSQIESYDNMVEVMVEVQRFVNPLGLDVLGYCILGRLSGKTGGINRSRLKGMNFLTRLTQKEEACSFNINSSIPRLPVR